MCQLSSYCLLAQISPSLPHFVLLELEAPVNDSLLPACGMLALAGEGHKVTLGSQKGEHTPLFQVGFFLMLIRYRSSGPQPCRLLPRVQSHPVALSSASLPTLSGNGNVLQQPGPGSASFCCCCSVTTRLHVSLRATDL